MTPNQLDIDTCDKRCGLHEYSLISGNLHALPFEFLVNCAKQIIEITSWTRTKDKRCISKGTSLIRCDGTLVLSLNIDTRSISRVVSDGGVFEFPGRVATEMLLDWHFSRSKWIRKGPVADTNVINNVLDLPSVLELLESLHVNASLNISPVLEKLSTMPTKDLLL
ncbi:hypothetical protein N7471_010588 [Penicillium samsonianum]|uniref:uncharacterized protein n=1 Tax=Penicillium samsonianum TaxID=1882272 RepID=UPI00254862D7|nr:uncharacterized protein N7471_010588 [Penicillium samsonianum]KAJ6126095.1 hypothetical protein N7471_010588 [Penicillium samsonianum]